jgi:hypothetical protein
MRLRGLLFALVLAGCGGPLSQPAARDLAASRSCEWFNKCGEVGSGKTYASMDSCVVEQRSDWNGYWPLAQCDGKILPADLDVCLKAIDSTICNNGFDRLNTLFNKCSKTQVCKG